MRARPLPERERWIPRRCDTRRLGGQPEVPEDRDDDGAVQDVGDDAAPTPARACEHILPEGPLQQGRPVDARPVVVVRTTPLPSPVRALPLDAPP